MRKRRLIAVFIAMVGAAMIPVQTHAEPVNLLESEWSEVLAEAAQQDRHLFIAFLGEGWSLGSKRFDRTVLQSELFQTFAEEDIVYCPVRARHVQKMEKKPAARLQSLVIYFDIEAYPTLLLIAPDGTEVLRHGYRDVTPAAYVELLKAILPPDS